ncbi:hypothetical protein PBI_AN9_87 [Mycobacterium phage AN9]|nr:hypothetical protein PBI_AN9_87 [Mycobacterium phage AN9]
MRVFVYKNLHRTHREGKPRYSVQALEGDFKGRVTHRSGHVLLANAKGVVRPAGRERVRREGKKNEYAETEARLQFDPIVVAMSVEMSGATEHIKASWTHDDGEPNFQFMQVANREYARRGGKDGGHIGAIAKALLKNVAIIEGKA